MKLTTLEAKELCLAVIGLFNLGLGFFVLIKQPKRLVNRAFATVATGIFVWGTGLILISRTHAFGWNTVIMYGFVMILYGLVVFARVFPNKPQVSRKFLIGAFMPLLSIIILTPMHLIVKSGIFRPDSTPEPVNGPFYFVLVVLSAAYVGASLWLFVRTFSRSRGRERDQMRYFLFGLSVFIVCAFLFDILLPSIGIYRLNFLGAMSSVVLTGTTAYAIVRHDLLDVRFIIQRGLIYTVLFAAIIGLYIIGIELVGYVLHDVTETSIIITGGIATTIGAFLIRPLEQYFKRATDAIFFKDSYDYAEALHTLSKVLQTSLDRNDIVSQSAENLRRIFKTDMVEFVFDPTPRDIADAKTKIAGFSTLAQPIMFEDTAVGILRLGAKRSGDTYTKRDLQLVSTFAYQAAVSIAKADLHAQVQGHSAHLEAVVEERTHEIKRMQEDQKQTMIDVSHNLQTPLAIIRGELEVLGEMPETEEEAAALSPEELIELAKIDTLRKSLDRVSGFIRQLLHLARLEHSLYTVERVPLDLSKLVREQADYFEVMTEEAGGSIETAIEDGCYVEGNKRLLEELFVNLVTNAMVYRSEERASVIRIALSGAPGLVTVVVSDNGIGISKEDLPEIFQRFYRVSQATPTVQGTGLGLAIVKNIVEKHDGAIRVESELGAGTSFIIQIPSTDERPVAGTETEEEELE